MDEITKQIISQLKNVKYTNGDISDLGNEIGIVIGRLSKDDIKDFKMGFSHGISLSDGTHC